MSLSTTNLSLQLVDYKPSENIVFAALTISEFESRTWVRLGFEPTSAADYSDRLEAARSKYFVLSFEDPFGIEPVAYLVLADVYKVTTGTTVKYRSVLVPRTGDTDTTCTHMFPTFFL